MSKILSKMKVSPIAKLVYTTLLGRTFLSRKNGLKDENGNVYVIYPVRALAKYIWVKRNKCQGKG